jgi:hypothetical protein
MVALMEIPVYYSVEEEFEKSIEDSLKRMQTEKFI